MTTASPLTPWRWHILSFHSIRVEPKTTKMKKVVSEASKVKPPQIDSVREFVYDEIKKHESGCTKDMLIKATD